MPRAPKPGLGGHLLGDKVTPGVARMREAVVDPSFLTLPVPQRVLGRETQKHVDWIKAINPQALVSGEGLDPTDVDMVAVGATRRRTHHPPGRQLRRHRSCARHCEEKHRHAHRVCTARVHRFLIQEGVRDKITVIAKRRDPDAP